jgi:hypothetical protein
MNQLTRNHFQVILTQNIELETHVSINYWVTSGQLHTRLRIPVSCSQRPYIHTLSLVPVFLLLSAKDVFLIKLIFKANYPYSELYVLRHVKSFVLNVKDHIFTRFWKFRAGKKMLSSVNIQIGGSESMMAAKTFFSTQIFKMTILQITNFCCIFFTKNPTF